MATKEKPKREQDGVEELRKGLAKAQEIQRSGQAFADRDLPKKKKEKK